MTAPLSPPPPPPTREEWHEALRRLHALRAKLGAFSRSRVLSGAARERLSTIRCRVSTEIELVATDYAATFHEPAPTQERHP